MFEFESIKGKPDELAHKYVIVLTVHITVESLVSIGDSVTIRTIRTSAFGCRCSIAFARTTRTGNGKNSRISLTCGRILVGCISWRFYKKLKLDLKNINILREKLKI